MNAKKNVPIIGATNRSDQIDSALLRPVVSISSSTSLSPTNLRAFLSTGLRSRSHLSPPRLICPFLAKGTHGFSGADLTEIYQRAAKLAIQESIVAEIRKTREKEAKEKCCIPNGLSHFVAPFVSF